MDEQERKQQILAINRAAIKRYILARIRDTRQDWPCERVSAEAYTFYEAFVWSEIRKLIKDPTGTILSAHDLPGETLLVRGTVRRRLLEALQDKLRWAIITRVNDQALDWLEDQLRQRIDKDIKFNYTNLKTFKP